MEFFRSLCTPAPSLVENIIRDLARLRLIIETGCHVRERCWKRLDTSGLESLMSASTKMPSPILKIRLRLLKFNQNHIDSTCLLDCSNSHDQTRSTSAYHPINTSRRPLFPSPPPRRALTSSVIPGRGPSVSSCEAEIHFRFFQVGIESVTVWMYKAN